MFALLLLVCLIADLLFVCSVGCGFVDCGGAVVCGFAGCWLLGLGCYFLRGGWCFSGILVLWVYDGCALRLCDFCGFGWTDSVGLMLDCWLRCEIWYFWLFVCALRLLVLWVKLFALWVCMVLISLVPRCIVILWFGCCALGFIWFGLFWLLSWLVLLLWLLVCWLACVSWCLLFSWVAVVLIFWFSGFLWVGCHSFRGLCLGLGSGLWCLF